MKQLIFICWALLATTGAACGALGPGQAAETEAGGQAVIQTRGPLPADSDLSTPPTASLSFASDWRVFHSGPLYHGADIQIATEPSRFPACGTGGTVTAFVRAEDGQVAEVVLDQGTPGEYRWGQFRLPGAGEAMEVWLRSVRSDGCEEWDSSFGENYRLALTPWRPVRVTFAADWTETVAAAGGLRAGDTLIIDYDFHRLPDCRVIYRGFPGWDILAHVRFDGGEVITQSLLGWPDMSHVVRQLGVIPIPSGAQHLELWFENDQYPPTCKGWDSNFGQNYRFDL